MKQVFTIGQVLEQIKGSYQNPKALANFTESGWEAISTAEFIDQVKYVALGLLSIGIKKGDKIGIIALPSKEWTIADYAIMSIGAVSVPLFANISDDNFHFEIEQTGLRVVFVGGEDQWTRSERDQVLFDHMIGLDNHPENEKEISYPHFLEIGKHYEKTLFPKTYEEIIREIQPLDIATIIYTSGSTGVPKGAVHTHRSLTSLLHTPIFSWNSHTDTYLSFLPLAHVFARVLNLIMTSWNISCYYFNDVKKLGEICKEIHPTVMVVVPRLLEKMYAKMAANVEAASPIKKGIGKFAFAVAHMKRGSFIKKIFAPLLEHLVYHRLREALGGRLRVVFCGGAPLNPQLYHFFLETGFPIYEGWGLTESCPICVNQPGKIKIGTVGFAINGMQVKVGEGGELLANGEMKMEGYYKNPTETARVFDPQRWLRTGDKGTIDNEGFVTILGRLEELYKSSTGEWIAPVPIEQSFSKVPFIDTAIVIGENRRFVSCLLVPEFEALQRIKKTQNAASITDQEFLESPFMQEEMKKVLERINASLNEWSQIRDYRFIPHTITIEAGELTPSMKVRRNKIEEKYKNLIDSIYEDKHT